jgi:hypothetical protein
MMLSYPPQAALMPHPPHQQQQQQQQRQLPAIQVGQRQQRSFSDLSEAAAGGSSVAAMGWGPAAAGGPGGSPGPGSVLGSQLGPHRGESTCVSLRHLVSTLVMLCGGIFGYVLYACSVLAD